MSSVKLKNEATISFIKGTYWSNFQAQKPWKLDDYYFALKIMFSAFSQNHLFRHAQKIIFLKQFCFKMVLTKFFSYLCY